MKLSMESRRLLLILQCGTEQRKKSKAKTGSPCHSSCATSWVQELSEVIYSILTAILKTPNLIEHQ